MAQTRTYYISHGFMGGSYHSRGLQRALEAQGLRPASLETADIVLVHSAACWLLPSSITPQMLVLVGAALPHSQPRQTYAEANRNIWRLARQQNRLGRRISWSFASWFYGLRNPARNYHLAKLAQQRAATLPDFAAQKVIFIANQFDPWPRSNALQEILNRPWAFISLTGSHENLWEEPEKYAEIVKQYV